MAEHAQPLRELRVERHESRKPADRVPRPDKLTIGVQKVAAAWALVDGNRVILSFGDKEAEARQVLQVIQHFKCDNLCRLGGGETPAMSFFMKTR